MLTEFRQKHGCDNLDFRLAQLLEQGNQAREPISKHLDDGIFELRARSKEGHLRVLYFFGPRHLEITALVAVLKKRKKADPADIKLAKRRRALIWSEQVKPNAHRFDS